jgi:hypothetical protein
VTENQNKVKGIVIHCRGLCLKIMQLPQLRRWQTQYSSLSPRFYKNSPTSASQIQHPQVCCNC